MDLILLAAGFATRLEPLTLNQPKHLLPIKNGLFIDRLIDQLKLIEDKFERKILITNDRYFDKFVDWQKGNPFKLELVNDGVREKNQRLGSAGDLIFTLKKAQINNDILVLASDFIFADFDFGKFLKFCQKEKTSVIAVSHENNLNELKSGSCLQMKGTQVTRFEEKPEVPFSNFYGNPYYFVKKEDLAIIKKLPKELWDNCGQLAAVLSQKSHLKGFIYDGKKLHMTTMADYERIKELNF